MFPHGFLNNGTSGAIDHAFVSGNSHPSGQIAGIGLGDPSVYHHHMTQAFDTASQIPMQSGPAVYYHRSNIFYPQNPGNQSHSIPPLLSADPHSGNAQHHVSVNHQFITGPSAPNVHQQFYTFHNSENGLGNSSLGFSSDNQVAMVDSVNMKMNEWSFAQNNFEIEKNKPLVTSFNNLQSENNYQIDNSIQNHNNFYHPKSWASIARQPPRSCSNNLAGGSKFNNEDCDISRRGKRTTQLLENDHSKFNGNQINIAHLTPTQVPLNNFTNVFLPGNGTNKLLPQSTQSHFLTSQPPPQSTSSASTILSSRNIPNIDPLFNFEPFKRLNLPNFDASKLASVIRVFIIKSFTEVDVHRSIKYGLWCSTERGNDRLNQAFTDMQNRRGRVFLCFSVNSSGHFCGFCEMISNVDLTKRVGIWSDPRWRGAMQVQWWFVKDIPNGDLRHIRSQANEGRPVPHSRDCTEVTPMERAVDLLQTIADHRTTSSLMEDFNYYEDIEHAATMGTNSIIIGQN